MVTEDKNLRCGTLKNRLLSYFFIYVSLLHNKVKYFDYFTSECNPSVPPLQPIRLTNPTSPKFQWNSTWPSLHWVAVGWAIGQNAHLWFKNLSRPSTWLNARPDPLLLTSHPFVDRKVEKFALSPTHREWAVDISHYHLPCSRLDLSDANKIQLISFICFKTLGSIFSFFGG